MRLAIITLALLPAMAQPWSGILDPSRAIDWSSTHPGVVGGIPTRGTVCITLTSSATTSAINSAISGCTAGQVVMLGAGTYTLSGGFKIGKSSITVRGAGPLQTILNFTGSDSCGGLSSDTCIQNSNPLYDGAAATQPGGTNAAAWTAGYSAGTTSITLTSVGSSPPQINDLIILDQANDTSDNSGLIICDVSTTCSANGQGGGRVVGGVSRSQTQVVKVTGISGSTYTISPGLYGSNWRSGQTPGAWWSNSPVHDVGIENMTVNGDAGSTATISTNFYNCLNCWMKNVRSIKSTTRSQVLIIQSAHVEIRDSYFFATTGGGVTTYVIEPDECADYLVENNIFHQIGAPTVPDGGAAGGVVSYNYNFAGIVFNSSTVMPFAYAGHAPTEFELYEGNLFPGITSDTAHGGSPLITIFRNQLLGNQPSPNARTQQTWAIAPQFGARIWNVIGNVLGTSGYHTAYETYPPSNGASCNFNVYFLGWPSVGCNNVDTPGNDTVVRSTMMRWGNYDTVNAAVRWDSTESSPGAVSFVSANSTPGSHTLPSSFYLSSKPTFFGSNTWPPIGPDITGGSGPAGLAYKIPAQVCFESLSTDSTFTPAMAFDGNACYYAPAATATKAVCGKGLEFLCR